MEKYRELNVSGDLGLRSFGRDFNEAFENMIVGLSSLIADVKPAANIEKKLQVEGSSREELVVNSLNELIYLFEVERFLPTSAKVSVGKKKKEFYCLVELKGENLDLRTRKTRNLVKAATFHDLKIKDSSPAEIRVIFDI
mgnify:CR=1 FL=1